MRFSFTSAVTSVAVLLGSSGSRADVCTPIRTSIATQYAVTGCSSAVGVCTVGSIASPTVAGTTQFTAMSVTPGPSPDLLFYAGELVITTSGGTLTLRDFGVLNTATARFFEVQHAIGGTGIYAGVSGTLTSQGLTTPTGFQGTLTGMTCKRLQAADRPHLASKTLPP